MLSGLGVLRRLAMRLLALDRLCGAIFCRRRTATGHLYRRGATQVRQCFIEVACHIHHRRLHIGASSCPY